MHDEFPRPPADFLTNGVLGRRVIAWAIDLIVIGVLMMGIALLIWTIGLVTLGLGWTLLVLLPLVPALYHGLMLLSPASATAGQQLCGLVVRRDRDLGPPTPPQALICVLAYYATWALSGILLIVALFTERNRALHDLLSGLVVVRAEAFEALTDARRSWNMGAGGYPRQHGP